MTPDVDIRRDVESELQWNPRFRDCHIGIIVMNGVVTLTGYVGHVAARWDAEEATKHVRGVKAVANNIEIKILPKNRLCDTEIAEAAAAALGWNVVTQPFALQAVVDQGHVTLSGNVPHGFQRTAAEVAVSRLKGVVGVTNQIEVTSSDVAPAVAELDRPAPSLGPMPP